MSPRSPRRMKNPLRMRNSLTMIHLRWTTSVPQLTRDSLRSKSCMTFGKNHKRIKQSLQSHGLLSQTCSHSQEESHLTINPMSFPVIDLKSITRKEPWLVSLGRTLVDMITRAFTKVAQTIFWCDCLNPSSISQNQKDWPRHLQWNFCAVVWGQSISLPSLMNNLPPRTTSISSPVTLTRDSASSRMNALRKLFSASSFRPQKESSH